MNLTQFFGAFNDNLFKQLVLLICVDYERTYGTNYQTLALFLFAFPFVLFSGFAGFLSDRISKQRIVVAMKIAEIGVMTAGFFAFQATFGQLGWLLAVIFLMATHSAFFGPAKYGILPEMFRESDLPSVNGMIQMTTFLAIICGAAMAGFTKEWYGDRLWIGSAFCIGIAVVGTLTSLLVRRTAVARPGLNFTPSALFISKETWRMLRNDRPLLQVLLVSSLFWFLGGVIQPTANAFGKLQLHYGDGRTSVMVVCMAVGIMVGCLGAGVASRGRVHFGLVKFGALGLAAVLAALALLGADQGTAIPKKISDSTTESILIESSSLETEPAGTGSTHKSESLVEVLVPTDFFEWIARGLLFGVGLFAGFFYVPLAVFMQVRPPEDQKGRMIGAMNLINWIGIMVAAVFYGIVESLCKSLEVRVSWIFALSALLMLGVALFYRPNARMTDATA